MTEKDYIEVERKTVCFQKSINWNQNEATQNLRQWVATLVDSLVSPISSRVAHLEIKLKNWCNVIDKERTEIKELIQYIKQYELIKEQEIKTLFSKLEQLETKINPDTIVQEIETL